MFHTEIDKEATLRVVEELGPRLPKPVGYQVLVIRPKIIEKTESGIIKPQEFLKKEEAGSVLGLVLSMGNMAYMDEAKFPTGPWVKEGDYVLVGAYRGARFSVDGHEFILIHDDMLMATVEDASGIGRAY